jgi:hypothetical protein
MDGGTVAALRGGRWEASRFAGATNAMEQ